VQSILPELGIPREKFVFVSGIGCSSRFPYYMNTYGSTPSTAGRRRLPPAPLANPELEVWVATGDGMRAPIGVTIDPRPSAQHRSQDPHVQQPDLWSDQGPVPPPSSEKEDQVHPFGSLDRP
jgi:2-oxoglutarate ferredoxin oxidoreductase subunit beta